MNSQQEQNLRPVYVASDKTNACRGPLRPATGCHQASLIPFQTVLAVNTDQSSGLQTIRDDHEQSGESCVLQESGLTFYAEMRFLKQFQLRCGRVMFH